MVKTVKTTSRDISFEVVQTAFGETPKTGYKYRSLSNKNHLKSILEGKIWVPSPKSLNDPFDCQIPVAYYKLHNDKKMARQFAENSIGQSEIIHEDQKEKQIQEAMSGGFYKDLSKLNEFTKQTLFELNEMTGVYCLSPVNDDILMWSHYSESHAGFIVGFDMEILCSFFGLGGFVMYRDDFPVILPTDSEKNQILIPLITKSTHWDYEVEYRVVKSKLANVEIELPANAIKEVIFGCQVDTFFRDCIIGKVKARYPLIKFFQASRKKEKFELEISPL